MLEIKNLRKNFGKIEVLKGISFSLRRGEILSIMGESGSGKSTLLRCIAGLEESLFDEFKCSGEVGLLFQNYALFPHLNVAQNIEFALNHLNKKERKERVNALLKRFEIENLAYKKIDEISGGQAQRVAFARALSKGASLILLDEPFSNLDQNLKESLRSELKTLLKREQITTIMVTHDINDAYFLSDKIALLSAGRFIDYNSPKELFYEPKNAQSVLMQGGLNVIDLKDLDNSQNDAFFKWLRGKNGIFAYSELVLGGEFEAEILDKLFLGAFYKLSLKYKNLQFFALFPSNLEFNTSIKFSFKA